MKAFVVAMAVAALLSACAAPAPANAPNTAQEPSAADLVEDGRAIAQNLCAHCHAIGDSGISPRRDAPEFRILLSRYSADALDQELIEGVRVTHEMPAFQISPQGADALVAYLRSVQQAAAAP